MSLRLGEEMGMAQSTLLVESTIIQDFPPRVPNDPQGH